MEFSVWNAINLCCVHTRSVCYLFSERTLTVMRETSDLKSSVTCVAFVTAWTNITGKFYTECKFEIFTFSLRVCQLKCFENHLFLQFEVDLTCAADRRVYVKCDVSVMQVTPRNTFAFHKDNNKWHNLMKCTSFISHSVNQNSTNINVFSKAKHAVRSQRRSRSVFLFQAAIFPHHFPSDFHFIIFIQ